MDALTFYGLRRTGERRWSLDVVPELLSGLGTLFGGCALGACIEVLERETGRPAVWATAQYLSYARPPDVLDIDVTIAAAGHQISQARAVASVGGEEIITVNAALGRRPTIDATGSWAEMPAAPHPDDCPPRPLLERHRGTVMERIEMRLAKFRDFETFPAGVGDGRTAVWVRVNGIDLSASSLAIVGDYVPMGIGQALGERAGGNSLDNTLRVVQLAPTDWILADIRVHAVHHGFGHGLVHLWAQDGALLATASQSTIVRYWKD